MVCEKCGQRDFIQEFRLATDREDRNAWDLEAPIPVPTVTLTREQLARFRNNYNVAVAFIAEMCDKSPSELCLLDMEIALAKKRGHPHWLDIVNKLTDPKEQP